MPQLQNAAFSKTPVSYHRLGHAGGWMPRNKRIIQDWVLKFVEKAEAQPRAYDFQPVIQEFQHLIENDSIIYMLFHQMFDQIPADYQDTDPTGAKQVLNYKKMLCCFNYIIQNAPSFNESGLVGFPMNAILDWPMGTPGGYAAFLNHKVNHQLRRVLWVWKKFLEGSESTGTLNSGPGGWFSEPAQDALAAALADGTRFEDNFPYDPTSPTGGYNSWDEFFIRPFINDARKVADADKGGQYIINACESAPYDLQTDVKLRDTFWIKNQPYSLEDILADQTDAQAFEGGTVYQAFLSALSYHRWHSPISGTIAKVKHIPGTYYSQCWDYGFANEDGKPDPAAPDKSQGYITSVATRVLIYIDADDTDNADIGRICFVAVGMAEVSSCQVTVEVGAHVDKGDEIGTFHFGGSTHLLIFKPGVSLTWTDEVETKLQQHRDDEHEDNIHLHRRLATVGTQ